MTRFNDAVDYFSKFRTRKIDEYADILREYKPTISGNSGYGWFTDANRVIQYSRDTYHSLEEFYADLSVPGRFVTPEALVNSWKVFKDQLEGRIAELERIKLTAIDETKHTSLITNDSFDDADFVPQPIIYIDLMHREVLEAVSYTLQMLGDDGEAHTLDDVSVTVMNIIDRFHRVAVQLQHRYGNRSTLAIDDEYDVQDLFHALLLTAFDDVRAEQYSPSYAGGAARIDFVLPESGIAIELKMMRDTLSQKALSDQILVDAVRYETHPTVKSLICFVYDPQHRLANARGLEADLGALNLPLPVSVKILPKP